MIITDSNITLTSTHSKIQQYERDENLSVLVGNTSPEDPSNNNVIDLVSISKDAKKHLKERDDHHEIKEIRIEPHEATKLGLLKNLVEAFTGKKIKIKELRDLLEDIHEHEDGEDKDDKEVHDDDHKQGVAWSINYSLRESYFEQENTSFTSEGVIRTADGREINFSLDLFMSRQYVSEQELTLSAGGVSTGPVVIDFQGPASELKDMAFTFGIEQKEDDSISYLALGGGLLVLDLNNNGQVDGLNELFGPSTGNGFAELATYDQDGNNWIDENDPVYYSLGIMTSDTTLIGLKDANIGAIYLGSVETPFDLKDSSNMLLGQIERSGLYLTEDGTPGVVNQISVIV